MLLKIVLNEIKLVTPQDKSTSHLDYSYNCGFCISLDKYSKISLIETVKQISEIFIRTHITKDPKFVFYESTKNICVTIWPAGRFLLQTVSDTQSCHV